MMPCYSPLKGYVKLGGGFTGDASCSNGSKMEVACGQCLGCRLDHARMWAMRIIHEASLYRSNRGSAFITLTYDDEHLPEDWSLCKRDFQLFMKRFRKKFDHKIRFYMCGEYGMICRHKLATEENDLGLAICEGCNVGRPHFHAIVFDCEFTDLLVVGKTDDITLYESDLLSKEWGMGFCSVGEVTMESAGYVARYAVKKITGKMALDHYITFNDQVGFTDVEPEFSTQSNRPGIGRAWFKEFSSDVFPSDEVPVPGQGVYKKVPRYYQNIFSEDLEPVTIEGWTFEIVGKTGDQRMIEEVKALRFKYLKANKKEFTPERLMDKYKVKKAQIKSLKREL